MKKEQLEKSLNVLFAAVFQRAPSAGQFEFKKHPEWVHFYNELRLLKDTLRGVLICRAINSGMTWFAVYHYYDQSEDKRTLVPNGATLYNYVEL